MTDLEMTKLCAEASGELQAKLYLEAIEGYDPLHDDAQAMALVKKFKLSIGQLSVGMAKVFTPDMKYEADDGDLNYAVVACVAKMFVAKRRK